MLFIFVCDSCEFSFVYFCIILFYATTLPICNSSITRRQGHLLFSLSFLSDACTTLYTVTETQNLGFLLSPPHHTVVVIRNLNFPSIIQGPCNMVPFDRLGNVWSCAPIYIERTTPF